MIKHYCDRCKKEIIGIPMRVENPVSERQKYELCNGCYKAFNEFMTNKND